MVCNLKESMQTMTAFGSFKVRRLKRYTILPEGRKFH
jgi:hypothetical protein